LLIVIFIISNQQSAISNLNYLPIIGIEVHVELNTKAKMFCGCSTNHFKTEPNTQTCPVCLGLPGALPVPNIKAIEGCIKIGKALGCKINKESFFERKNYFYPDLPKGYQISQYKAPFCINGEIDVSTISNQQLTIRINRVHMEEETAKMVYKNNVSLIDFNRSGVPLVEIVSEPDMHSSEQAVAYLKKIQQIVRYLGVSDCDMEKGSMRCEANISLLRNRKQTELPNYRVEIKNVNSFRFVKKALEYEIKRQTNAFKNKQKLNQETRGYDEDKGETYLQRSKEDAHDYRYFPEPDIPVVNIQKSVFNIEDLPELPDQKKKRFTEEYQISGYNADILTRDKTTAEYFEKAVKESKNVITNMRSQLSYSKFVKKIAKVIVNKRADVDNLSPKQLVKQILQKKKQKISDDDKIKIVVQKVIKENQKAVDDFREGKKEVVGFLIGQVMKETKGKAEAQIVRKIFIQELRKIS